VGKEVNDGEHKPQRPAESDAAEHDRHRHVAAAHPVEDAGGHANQQGENHPDRKPDRPVPARRTTSGPSS
jgi:hypothetical protein